MNLILPRSLLIVIITTMTLLSSESLAAGDCVFRPEAGKYVVCNLFHGGKCKTGTRTCQPKSLCVFQPKLEKYIQCNSFAAGTCKTGTRTCQPKSKCVFRPEQGKYVQCNIFAAGQCKGGTRACKPS